MSDIIKADDADQPALIETLAQAFQTDPALSWIMPDPGHRARALRGLFRVLVPGDRRVVVTLSLLVAALALVDAVTSLVMRWFSARIGEGLIFDLRTQVFGHVLRQPIAFFTRAQTGALVSRLNNDVIGAQRHGFYGDGITSATIRNVNFRDNLFDGMLILNATGTVLVEGNACTGNACWR